MRGRLQPLTVSLVFAMASLAPSAGAAPATIDFNRDIRPILSDNCFACHGQDPGSRKARLRLDDRAAALKGGKSGSPALVPGKPEQSEILLRAGSPHDDERMPPIDSHKQALSESELAKLRAWISQGAEYQPHWAFIPPKKPELAAASAHARANPIDTLVSARLRKAGLALSPAAKPETLARRLYLDVIGLPPSPTEVAAYQRDGFEATLEQLLQRETYGEKWARHWLDVGRYSDSNGYEKDLPRQQWAWRDWVIGAFNRDLPYNQFIVEQLAGDLLPGATQDQIVATGFLRNSMLNEEGAIVPEQFRLEEMFDRMDTIGKGVLGLTLQCAQCHTHKFDPISHDEYFSLFAFINNSYEAQSWVYTPEQRKLISELEASIASLENKLKAQRPRWAEELAKWEDETRAQQIPWTPLMASDLGSVGGSVHPTQEPDGAVISLGSIPARSTMFLISEQSLEGLTAIRFEALAHPDLPFNGPGRSKYGSWALSELTASVQVPGSETWQKLRLVNPTADFALSEAKLEGEWAVAADKEKPRRWGPVEFLIDGKTDTAWNADRGVGLRNQDSVAVAQFDCEMDYPKGTKLKVEWAMNHSGNERDLLAMLGRCRISVTTAPKARALPIDYAAVQAMAVPPAQRTPAQAGAVFSAWRKTLADAEAINEQIAAAWAKYPKAPTSVLHVAARTPLDPRRTKLLDRGTWDRPKHDVKPGTLQALHPFPAGEKRDRLGLARWLVDGRSPLAARVAVNRVWQAVFGMGLVETAEDFGTRAPLPEYLEVLDWLALDFVQHGWSQKHLLRTILRSQTYRQSSRYTPELIERDPQNRLLARGPRFRLEAEVIRDSALSIAGLLTPGVGGPSFFPPVPQSVLDYNYTRPAYWIAAKGPDRYRRALYVFRKRSMPDPALGAFDAPTGDTSCVRRPRSNTPLAALTSLNEPVFVEAAQALAVRIVRDGGRSDTERADFAYRLCTGRPIKPVEQETVATLLRDTRKRFADGWLNPREIATGDPNKLPSLAPETTPSDAAAWTVVARVLLNLDETLTKL